MTNNYQKELEQVKSLRKLGVFILISGWLIWFVETLIYMIMYGYHKDPATDVEKFLDGLSTIIMAMGIMLMFRSIWRFNGLLIKALGDDQTFKPQQ
jgi:hypothetical protein